MSRLTIGSFLLAFAGACVTRTVPAAPSLDARAVLLNVDEIQWEDTDWGAKIATVEGTAPYVAPEPFTFLVTFPKSFRVPLHHHLGTERVTVLGGAISIGYGDEENDAAAVRLSQGGFGMWPVGVQHYGFTTDSEVVLFVHGVGPHFPAESDPQPPPSGFDPPLDRPFFRNAADVTYEGSRAVLEGSAPFREPKEITLRLRLAAGEQYSQDTAERLVVVSGAVTVSIGTNNKTLRAGGLAIIPPGRKHSLVAETDAVVEVHAIGPYQMPRR
jgi:quercetin dioxygenase-like cupin family protein